MAAPDRMPQIARPLVAREPSIHGSSTMANKVQEWRIRLLRLKGELVDRARAETLMFRRASRR